jgi:hypothetical protein
MIAMGRELSLVGSIAEIPTIAELVDVLALHDEG